MTPNDVKKLVAEIDYNRNNNETAHRMEDELYTNVLRVIAVGSPNAQKLAQEALRAKKILFTRWYS